MITKFSQAIRAYYELVQTGGIQCTAEGENVLLDLRGNLTGDVLLFIGPKNNDVASGGNIYELIKSDALLVQQSNLVFKSMKQKYKGLSLLPESLVWILNGIFFASYAAINSGRICRLFAGEIGLKEILAILPLAVVTVISPFLSKAIGFKVMKPVLSLVLGIVRFFRKKRNKQVA